MQQHRKAHTIEGITELGGGPGVVPGGEGGPGTSDRQRQSAEVLRQAVRMELRALLEELGVMGAAPDRSAARPAWPEATGGSEGETMGFRELSALLGLNRKTTYNQITLGQIPGVRRLGRRIVVHRATVINWL